MPEISQTLFVERFVATVQRGRSFPKKEQDRHILYRSALLGLEPGRSYTEAEINDMLQKWTLSYGELIDLDHAMLRRYLIDEGYLRRDPAGTTYEVDMTNIPYAFAPEIGELDLDQALIDAEAERAARKQRYLQDKG